MYAIALAVCLFVCFIARPLAIYYPDAKGLRQYPNFTLFSGISDLPFSYESHKGFRPRSLFEAHQKHPVLRIGPNALSFSDPRAIKDIYGHGTPCIKDRFYSETAGTHSHLAEVVDKGDHARKRKILSSAYALKNLEEWEFKVADVTGKLIQAFDARCTAPLSPGAVPETKDLTVDFRNWTVLFTAVAIASIGLSEDLGFLSEGTDNVKAEFKDGTVKEVSFRDCHAATVRVSYQIVWAYDWFKTFKRVSQLISPSYRQMWKLDSDWAGIVYNRATTRLKQYMAGEKIDDFFTAMKEDKDGPPHNLEWGEIVAEINIMMNAGHDTTVISLRNVLFFLLKYPRHMAKLHEELDEALDEDEIVAPYGKVKHLPYLRACIDESLRMMPPVILGLPRRTPLEGAPVLDGFVAGNTSVSMSAYVVHHQESIFEDHGIQTGTVAG